MYERMSIISNMNFILAFMDSAALSKRSILLLQEQLWPFAVKRDIAITIFVCVSACVSACVRPSVRSSGFALAITSTFMHGFQNNLTQLLSLRRRIAI